jgi:integrase
MKGSRPLTRQQVKGLLALTDTIREQTLLTLGFCTGYRISELLSLKVTVKAANTKTKTGRSVLLNADAQKALKRLIDVIGISGQSPLFISRKHDKNGNLKAISRQQAHDLLKALFAKIGEFGNVSTHTLRKTFAARIYEQTGKLEIVQIALGHKSINSTISYLAFGNDDLNRAIMGVM